MGNNENKSTPKEIIQLMDVSFRYETEQPTVLHQVSLTVNQGESILMLGSSGAGKSTLLSILSGFIPRIIPGHLEGAILLQGMDAAKMKMADFAHTVSTVMQNPESQLTSLTVEDEIAFALENFKVPRQEILDRVGEIIKQTGMERIRDHEVYALSGGQQQRLSIACALVREPQMVILDEPLSNLDPLGATEVMEIIGTIMKKNNTAVVMTAHDFSGFPHLFERVIVIDQGKIAKDGPIQEVLSDVPFFREKGLEIPVYIEWAYEHLGDAMKKAPLSVEEAHEMIKSSIGKKYSYKNMIPEKRARPEKKQGLVPALKVSDVDITFGKNRIVENVNFQVESGEIVALLGYNGSGKSTIALAIAGAIAPSSGSIEIFSEKLQFRRGKLQKNVKAKVGYVFQYPEHQFIYDSVLKEMMHDLKQEHLERARQELKGLGLPDDEKHPYELSGGEKRRLSVKSSIMIDPDILILDEPTYGQDARYRSIIEKDLMELHAKGKTIFIITHDMSLVDRIATKVLVMHYGKLVFSGTPDQLFSDQEKLNSYGLERPLHYAVNEYQLKGFEFVKEA